MTAERASRHKKTGPSAGYSLKVADEKVSGG